MAAWLSMPSSTGSSDPWPPTACGGGGVEEMKAAGRSRLWRHEVILSRGVEYLLHAWAIGEHGTVRHEPAGNLFADAPQS